MYLLDTNAISNHFRGTYPLLSKRIDNSPFSSLWVSGIAVAELLKGRLAKIHEHLDSPPEIGEKFELLARSVYDLSKFQILPYDRPAAEHFGTFGAKVTRHGALDCRIAASAIVYGFTVITANRNSFSNIPGVQWEDWSN